MSTQTSDNNKRIAKNTLLLYFRMLFMMVVSLYTSRVILNALGVEDFGIYNVVGGVVAMFSVISGSLSAAISRFITYELGKGDLSKLNKIFSASVTIQLLLSLIIVVLIESVGVWFLNAKMTIPVERMTAANWVLQFSIITFVINLISVPYNAAIIAHEKMSAFAYISILEAVGKLAIAFLIMWSPIDKLVYYAILMCAVAVVVRFTYGHYCKKHFTECTYHFHWDKDILKKMFGFAGWNFIGASSVVLRDQGGNIILNIFFGPTVNAARGIANQVNTAITGFVQNFMTALNPQITKSYASDDREYMMTLIFQGARLSFYMLLLLSLPVLVNTHYILVVWLKLVPEHAVLFVRLILIFAMCESISNPLITAMLATGKIRNYQIVVGGLQLLNLPLSYICLRLGFIPESIIIVAIIISLICLFARLYMLRSMIGLSSILYMKKVLFNILLVALFSTILPYILFYSMKESLFSFIIITLIAVLCTLVIEFYIGCNKKERSFILNKVQSRMNKIKLTFWNKPNFGDVLSPYLINKLSGEKIQYKSSYTSWKNAFRNFLHYIKCGQFGKICSVTFPCEHVLLSIGSILSYSGKNATVWGSGFMTTDEPFKGGHILAVRGKYSNEKLKKMGYEGCNVFGDPALLAPIVYPASKTSEYKIGIIPHWKEVDFFKKAYSDKYLVIDLRTTDVENVINQIVSCQYILSTSLHGIIISHAYGVPALWIEKGNIDTDGIKFKDYFSSVGIELYEGFKNYDEILSENFNIEKLFEEHKEIANPKISISTIQKSLLSVAPFKILEKYKL